MSNSSGRMANKTCILRTVRISAQKQYQAIFEFDNDMIFGWGNTEASAVSDAMDYIRRIAPNVRIVLGDR